MCIDKDLRMALLLAALLLSAQPAAQATPAASQPSASAPSQAAGAPSRIERPDDLLALPKGRSTVIGGIITRLDPVSDTLQLHVYGGKRIRIYFDARTLVYRNGEKSTLNSLRLNERASVETMSDGDTIFARSIHMLSETPQGEFQGQVIAYDPSGSVLTVNEPLSNQPIKLTVPAGTPITRKGQAASASAAPASPGDLVKGALITAVFHPDNNGQGVAQQITILAVPGEMLTFTGTVTYLNLRLNQLAVTDSGNGQNYTLHFNAGSLPAIQQVRDGARVRVRAEFDGDKYQARSLDVLP